MRNAGRPGGFEVREGLIRPGQDLVMAGFAGLAGTRIIGRERRADLEALFCPGFLELLDEPDTYDAERWFEGQEKNHDCPFTAYILSLIHILTADEAEAAAADYVKAQGDQTVTLNVDGQDVTTTARGLGCHWANESAVKEAAAKYAGGSLIRQYMAKKDLAGSLSLIHIFFSFFTSSPVVSTSSAI